MGKQCPGCGAGDAMLHADHYFIMAKEKAEWDKPYPPGPRQAVTKEDPWAARAPTALSTQVGGDHYKTLAIQPIEYITKNNLGWCEGNIIKYITRWKQKGGNADIDKVIHYANLLKEVSCPQTS